MPHNHASLAKARNFKTRMAARQSEEMTDVRRPDLAKRFEQPLNDRLS
jgi:hypothetical protein